MTIKTLEHIHKLLIRNEDNSLFLYKEARQSQYKSEESGIPDAEQKKKTADTLYQVHSEAFDALQEFENQDWR